MIHLHPMIYSKAKSMAQVRAKLVEKPEQLCESGNMEFHLPGRSACGTLSEYGKVTNTAIIHCVDGDLVVEQDTFGRWYVMLL